MIFGEWIEIKSEVIYYAYDRELSRISSYKPDITAPICISCDFNIGDGKPMSWVFFQYIKKKFYFFAEIVVNGMRTLDALEEAAERGLLNHDCKYIIHGDASGRARTTKYNKTDYEVIREFLESYRQNTGQCIKYIDFEIDVPVANPPVRKRHLIVNGQLKNAYGRTNVYVLVDECPTLDKGLSLAKLKKGGQYIEDDRDPWQHITTAAGYGMIRQIDSIVEPRTTYKKAYG